MKILVTGASGFIGGWLARYLQTCGYSIRKAFRAPSPYFDDESILIDWECLSSINKAVKGVDVVIHAAGMDARACELNPNEAINFNGLKTKFLLSAAIHNNVKKFIYLSTAHVYKSPLVGCLTELSPTVNPHPYATSHKIGEDAVLEALEANKINGLVLRLSNIYGMPSVIGESNSWNLFINQICRQSLKEKKINLRSNGEDWRDFLAISDFCQITEKLLLVEKKIGVVNVGSGDATKIIDVARIVQEKCNQLFFYRPGIFFPDNTAGDVNAVKEKLDFQIKKLISVGVKPQLGIHAGIELMLIDCAKFI